MPLTSSWASMFLGAVSDRPYLGDAYLLLALQVGSSTVTVTPTASFKYFVSSSSEASMNWVGLFNVSAYVGSGVLSELRLMYRSGSSTVVAYVSFDSETISQPYLLYRLELKFPHSGSCPF